MSYNDYVLLGTLALTVILFLSQKVSSELIGALAITCLVGSGIVEAEEALKGFSSPTLIMMVSTFALAGGLRVTGVASWLAKRVLDLCKNSLSLTVFCITILCAMFSSFMNNVAAVALFIPTVSVIAARTGTSPSIFYMPISFGAVLGGMTTPLGTSANMIVSNMSVGQGRIPIQSIDFFLASIVIVIFGAVFLAILCPKLFGKYEPSYLKSGLVGTYKLHEHLTLLKIPKGSKLKEKTLSDIQFSNLLGGDVVAIERGHRRILAPRADEILYEEDRLLVEQNALEISKLDIYKSIAKKSSLNHKTQIPNYFISCESTTEIPISSLNISDELIMLGGILKGGDIESGLWSCFSGKTIPSRSRIFFAVKDRNAGRYLDTLPLSKIEFLETEPKGFGKLVKTIEINEELVAKAIAINDLKLEEIDGLRIVGILRDGEIISNHTMPFKDKDILIVTLDGNTLSDLSYISELELIGQVESPLIESAGIGLYEVLLAPRSRLLGVTIAEAKFRERFDFSVLAVWRDGRPIRGLLRRIRLKLGDTLLLQGPRNKAGYLSRGQDFVPLNHIPFRTERPEKALYSVTAILFILGFGLSGLLPLPSATLLAAMIILISGTLTWEEFFREVEWKIVFSVGFLLSFGPAISSSHLLTTVLTEVEKLNLVPYSVTTFLIFALISSLLSQILEASIAAVLLSPVIISWSMNVGVSPTPLLLASGLGASVAFIFPMSHRAHLLIVNAGGYQNKDFMKIGIPISIVGFASIVMYCFYMTR